MSRIRQARRSAARLAAVLALSLLTLPMLGGTAAAGGTCFATRADAPIYAGDNPWTEIVGHLDPGTPVNGTRGGADALWQVSRTDNGHKLGYMRPADLRCDGG
ncbi:hypothetical protein [Streptomyces longisporoflavus]|uniref:SH3 domain-containing protein n=1 Tax=Streptomyces longisporoflavus TaxID=28044 RepID=A0ABW7QS58_9ACTN